MAKLPALIKNCLSCKQNFEHSRKSPKRKYCSFKCAVKNITGARHYRWKGGDPTHVCLQCGISYQRRTNKNTIPKFCSKNCANRNRDKGLTDRVRLLRFSKSYKEWREAIFKRDNYTCQFCSQYGGKLQADHIKSFARYPELRFELSNGRTLCIDCHYQTDTYGGKTTYARIG